MTDSLLVYTSNSDTSGKVAYIGRSVISNLRHQDRLVLLVEDDLLGSLTGDATFVDPRSNRFESRDMLEDMPRYPEVSKMVHALAALVRNPYLSYDPNPRAIRLARSVEPGYATAIILYLKYWNDADNALQTVAKHLYPDAARVMEVLLGEETRTVYEETVEERREWLDYDWLQNVWTDVLD